MSSSDDKREPAEPSAYQKLPADSRELLELAVRMLDSPVAALARDEIVLMIYNLGRDDGGMEQLERGEALVREKLGL